MVEAELCSYRVLDVIQDLLIDQQRRSFYQRLKYYTLETYSSRPDYLISGGGFWTPSLGTLDAVGVTCAVGCDDEGRAVPITLMPSDQFVSSDNMIRFDGTATFPM